MNIRQKVIGCGLVSILASTLLGGVGYWGQAQLAERLSEARITTAALRNHLEADMMHDALRADVLAALTLTAKDSSAMQEVRADYQEHSAQFRKSMQENMELALPERIRQAVTQAQPALESYIVQAGQVIEAAIKDRAQAEAQLPDFKRHFSELEEKNSAISALIEQQVQAAEHHADQQVSAAIWWLLGGIVAVGGVMVLITLELLGRVLKPLNQAVALAGSIAKGNLRNNIKVERQDEAGLLLHALQDMQENLRQMINNIRHEGERLGQAAETLSHASGTIVRSAVEESDSATSMAAAMEEMIRNISQVATHAQDAYALSYQSENLAGNGGQVILSVVDSMERIAESVNESSATMTTLGKASEEIQSIIQNITGIAEQTNLLALNAAIEAARAGEQGRGFAVVADEVRNLAVRTANSTQEITGMIERIRRSTEQAVQSMQSGVECVSEGVELARHAGESIGEIQGGAHRAAGVVGEISQTMGEQSKASTEVAQRVESIAEMSRRSRETVEELSEAINLLKSVLTTLQGSVRQFQL